MSPDELKAILRRLGWSLAEVARRTRCHRNTPERWASGAVDVPGEVAAWLWRVDMIVTMLGPCPPWRTHSKQKDG